MMSYETRFVLVFYLDIIYTFVAMYISYTGLSWLPHGSFRNSKRYPLYSAVRYTVFVNIAIISIRFYILDTVLSQPDQQSSYI